MPLAGRRIRLGSISAVKQIEPISVEDYLADELVARVKHEYTGGHIYAMADEQNVHHAISGAFLGLMYAKLRGRPCQVLNSDTKVRMRMASHTRFYYPDGMVVCEPNAAGETFQDRPVVLAEVMSASTRRTDEGEKRDAYLSIPTLSAYLMIETTTPRVVVHHRTDSGFVTRLYEGLDAVVPLEAIGAELALADLYERVDFTAAVAEHDAELDELSRAL